MATPTKTPVSKAVRDTGLAAALSTLGWPARLEDRGGTIFFLFESDPKKFAELEDDYWSGRLKLSARDLIANQKMLKDRLYALKRPAHFKAATV